MSFPGNFAVKYSNKSCIYSMSQFRVLQDDQLNMTVLFWYLVKSVHVYSRVCWTSHFLQGTLKTGPCLTGHPVFIQLCMNKQKTLNLCKITNFIF